MKPFALERAERPSASSMNGRSRRAAALVALVCISLTRPAAALLPDDCVALGTALVEHSCFHSTFGPFHSVLATPGTDARPETPDVDAVHTEYRVGLPDPSGANVVTYEPERSGAWSVFLGSDIDVAVLDETGAALPELLTQRGNTGCDALPVAHVFELNAEQRYRLVLGPPAEESVVLVIEYTDDFLVESGPDRDGDGYGSAVGTEVTNCKPEQGFASNATDCNDQDAAIHPGAAERCDGVDQNCNGSADDAGLTCRAGIGRCGALGIFECAAGASEARCTAQLGAPREEVCNQIDDDCNGTIDDSPSLCSDEAAPVCVREGLTAFCGCVIDLDCGDATSGERCDAEVGRCDAGAGRGAGGAGAAVGGASGAAGISPTPSESGAGGEEPDSKPEPDVIVHTVRSCGCRTPGDASNEDSAAFVALLGAAAGAFRRRARRRRAAAAMLVVALGSSACGGKVLTSADGSEHSHAATTHSHAAAGHSHGASGGAAARAGSGGTAAGGTAGTQAGCTDIVAAIPVEHACSHATNGSFENTLAARATESAPAVDLIHQTYAVELPDGGVSPGFVSYVASRDGEHLVLTGGALPIRVRDREGQDVAPITFGPVSGCSTLTYGYAVTLSLGESYLIALGPSDGDPVVLFMEHLETFGDDAWSVRCGGAS